MDYYLRWLRLRLLDCILCLCWVSWFLGSVMVLCLRVLVWVSWLVVMLVICFGCVFGLIIVVAGCAVLVASVWWFWFDFDLPYWWWS